MRFLPLILALVFLGCDGHDHDHDHDHDHGHAHKEGDHDHDHDDDHDHDHEKHEHAHAAKYGGKLVELGKHEFQVELLAYPETGVLEAYIFDGCVERAIPTAMAVLKVEAQVGDETVTVELKPDANPYADEVEGKATKFKGQSDKLKKQDHFDGKLVEVSVAGKSFKDVEFHYHVGGDHDHDHDDHDH